MFTSVMLFALTGTPAADPAEGSVWMTDYVQARKVATSEGKPLAVFVAPGKNAWGKLSNAGTLPDAVERSLSESFVRCFVDSTTPAGKRLADSLELNSGLGLVISDRTGELMAFYHEGDLTNSLLTQYLQRYGDPTWVVTTTETNPGHGHRGGSGYGGACYGGACYSGGCSDGGCYGGGCYGGRCNGGGCGGGRCRGGRCR